MLRPWSVQCNPPLATRIYSTGEKEEKSSHMQSVGWTRTRTRREEKKRHSQILFIDKQKEEQNQTASLGILVVSEKRKRMRWCMPQGIDTDKYVHRCYLTKWEMIITRTPLDGSQWINRFVRRTLMQREKKEHAEETDRMSWNRRRAVEPGRNERDGGGGHCEKNIHQRNILHPTAVFLFLGLSFNFELRRDVLLCP